MKFVIAFLLLCSTACAVIVLDVQNCREETYGEMKFAACNVERYTKYYFEDATGINQITTIPDRLYHNHNHITAYSTDSQLFIGKKLYKKQDWFRFRESLI